MRQIARTAAGALCALSVAQGAAAFETDPKPGFFEVLTLDSIASLLANSTIAALRTFVEIEYEHMTTDVMRGTIALSGVTLRPALAWDRAQQCEIRIERAVIASDVGQLFVSSPSVDANLVGLTATTACLVPDMALALRTMGLREIAVDQFKVSGHYVYGTGEIAIDSTLALNNLAVLDLSASGSMLPRLDLYGRPGTPAVRVTRAVFSLRDMGGWEALSAVLPENLRDPATIRAMGQEVVADILSDGGYFPLGAVERNFINSLMEKVQDYVTDPGEITIEAVLPPGGIVLEPDAISSPGALVAGLALQARTAPAARSRLLPVSQLAALANSESIPGAQRLALARALLAGQGVPRASALVPDVLSSLIEDPELGGEASLLMAQALQDSDPARAYVHALSAGALGVTSAVALLDRLETMMTTGQVLQAQLEASIFPSLPQDDDPRTLRRSALAHFTGIGAPRDYALSYYYALLAEAAGDIAAPGLIDEIEARFATRGPEARDEWIQLRAEVQIGAIEDWVKSDLPARYSRD